MWQLNCHNFTLEIDNRYIYDKKPTQYALRFHIYLITFYARTTIIITHAPNIKFYLN